MSEQTDRFSLKARVIATGNKWSGFVETVWNAASDGISAEATQLASGTPGGMWGDLRNALGAIDEAMASILSTDFCK